MRFQSAQWYAKSMGDDHPQPLAILERKRVVCHIDDFFELFGHLWQRRVELCGDASLPVLLLFCGGVTIHCLP